MTVCHGTKPAEGLFLPRAGKTGMPTVIMLACLGRKGRITHNAYFLSFCGYSGQATGMARHPGGRLKLFGIRRVFRNTFDG
jgi:hypothetical protein